MGKQFVLTHTNLDYLLQKLEMVDNLPREFNAKR